MSVISTLKFNVYGDSHQDLIFLAENRIAEFFETDSDEISKKFSYELLVTENQEMVSGAMYEAEVVVRSRNV